MTATTKFWPAGRSLNDTCFIESVWPSGCFAIPAPIVTRGDELCSGYGTTPDATPRMTSGSTSRWVVSFVIADRTRNVLWQYLHSRSASSSRLPMFTHVTSLRLRGCLHSLQRLGTSYG